jgi:hypothetical protein
VAAVEEFSLIGPTNMVQIDVKSDPLLALSLWE